jgi:hypothetical protein
LSKVQKREENKELSTGQKREENKELSTGQKKEIEFSSKKKKK